MCYPCLRSVQNVTNFQNIDKVRSRGAEVAYEGQDMLLRGLDLIANVAYTQSKIIANANNPASMPNTCGGTSTYFVVDMKLTYKPTKRTELGVGIDNLFERCYYVFHPYAGRTFFYVEGRIGI